MADVEEDSNSDHRRSSNCTRRSSASWPEQTPDPLGPMARYSIAYSVEEIDGLSSSQGNMLSSEAVEEIMSATRAAVDIQEGGLMRHHQARLYDSPKHVPYIPASKSRKPQSLDSSKPQICNSPKTHLQFRSGRCRSSFNLGDLDATILFFDLEGYSKTTNLIQRHITRAFMNTLRTLLTFCYGALPSRTIVSDYVILPTGDGAALVVIRPPARRILDDTDEEVGGHFYDEAADEAVDDAGIRLSQSSLSSSLKRKLFGLHCSSCSRKSLQTTEETALWIGSSLLLWAESLQIGLRVGLNTGELSIVEDPYGDPNVCGDAINMAARIMDTALPG